LREWTKRPAETVIAQFLFDFSPGTPNLIPTFAAIIDVDSGTATFNVRLSVTPHIVDGNATITKTAEGGLNLLSVVSPCRDTDTRTRRTFRGAVRSREETLPPVAARTHTTIQVAATFFASGR
jgi:hypothetical protein